jgi:SAM-dependent methyltransferase
MGNRAPTIHSQEYYQRIHELEDRHWWYVGMRDIAWSLVRPHTAPIGDLHVLDAGCGPGSNMAWARECLGATRVVGVDVSWCALGLCRKRRGARLSQASIVALPFRSNCFDLVICCDVLQHLPTDGADALAVKEMYRVTRPGGALFVRSNSRLGMGRGNWNQDADFQQYSVEELSRTLGAAGYVVDRATYANTIPSLYGSLKRVLQQYRCRRRAPLYGGLKVRMLPPWLRWLNSTLRLVLKAEARYLARPDRRSGFGHTTMLLGLKPSAQSPPGGR